MKLFVLVRRDLPPSQQAVQAGHAVGQWCLAHQGRGWNGTLVYLTVEDELDLRAHSSVMQVRGVPHEVFQEPDMGDAATALAVCASGAEPLVKRLPLL